MKFWHRLVIALGVSAAATLLVHLLLANGLTAGWVTAVAGLAIFLVAFWLLSTSWMRWQARLCLTAGIGLAYVPSAHLIFKGAELRIDGAHWVVPVTLALVGFGFGLLDYLQRKRDREAPAISSLTEIPERLRGISDAVSELATTATGADSDIDDAVDAIKSHQFEVALAKLRDTKDKRWPTLKNRERFRVLANMGASHLGLGDTARAADAFSQASEYKEGQEKAQVLGALAHWLRGEDEMAVRQSKALRIQYPDAPIPVHICLSEASEDESHAALAEDISPKVLADLDVAKSLSNRAIKQRDYDAGIRYARAAADETPNHYMSVFQLAIALLARETAEASLSAEGDLVPPRAEAIQEAITHLNRADALAKVQAGERSRPMILLKLSVAHTLAGREDLARESAQAAYSLDKDNPRAATIYVQMVADRDGIDTAKRLLQRTRERGVDNATIRLLGAQFALSSGSVSDEDRAALDSLLEGWRMAADEYDGLSRYAQVAVLLSVRVEDTAVTEALIKDEWADLLRPSICAALRAQLLSASGDNDAASEQARLSAESLDASLQPEDRRFIARTLAEYSHFDLVAKTMLPLVADARPGHDCHRYLDALSRSGNHNAILEHCHRVRDTGVFDPVCLQYEVEALLVRDDRASAKELALSYAAALPEDRMVRVFIGLLGARLDDKELLNIDPESLPDPLSGSLALASQIIAILRLGPQPQKALEAAYALVRKHFDRLEAHLAIMSVINPVLPRLEIEDPTEVTTETAVEYRETVNGKSGFIVIEDDGPDPARMEHSADSALGEQLLDKHVGDTFKLAPATLNPREAEIVKIRDKFLYRAYACMTSLDSHFPGQSVITSLTPPVDQDGQIDAEGLREQMMRVMQPGIERDAEVMGLCREGKLPVSCAAPLFGVTAFEAIYRLYGAPDHRVLVCAGTQDEWENALAALAPGARLVLDSSALGTLWAAGLFSSLRCTPDLEFLVPRPCLDVVRERLEELRRAHAGSGLIGADAEGPVRTPPEALKPAIDRLERLLGWIDTHCSVCPGGTDKVTAAALGLIHDDALARETLEALNACVREDAVLWSDDQLLVILMQEHFAIRRVWTQPLIEHLAGAGGCSREFADEAAAHLADGGAHFTRMTTAAFIRASVLCSHDPEVRPLSSVLRTLEDPSAVPVGVAIASAHFLAYLSGPDVPRVAAANLSTHVLRALSSRPDHPKVLSALDVALDGAFGQNVAAAAGVRAQMRFMGLE